MWLADFLHRRDTTDKPLAHAELTKKQRQERLAQTAQALMFVSLCESGGALRLPVLLRGALQDRTLWEIDESLDLSLGEKSSMLLQCLQLALEDDEPMLMPHPSLENGDIFLFDTIYQRVVRERTLSCFRRELLEVSPLSRWMHCPVLTRFPLIALDGEIEARPAISREEAHALTTHPAMPFVSRRLADTWGQMPMPDEFQEPDLLLGILHTYAATLRCSLDAIASSEAVAALLPFMLFFQRILHSSWAFHIGQIEGFRRWRVSQRESLLHAYRLIVMQGARMAEIERTLITEPGVYGWSNPMEVRLFRLRFARFCPDGNLYERLEALERQLRP